MDCEKCLVSPLLSISSTHSNDMCVFELVLRGDEERGEVLWEEAGECGRVGEQHLNSSRFYQVFRFSKFFFLLSEFL